MTIPVARRLPFSEIPLIDLAPTATNINDSATVQSIYQACTSAGFFYITGHDIDAALISKLLAHSKVFFALPESRKKSLILNPRMRGYLPLYYRSYEGEERAGTSHQEGFWIGHDSMPDPARPLQGPNCWPDDLPEFQFAMSSYLEAVEALGHRLLRLFCRALKLPGDSLDASFNHPNSRLKLNHYPPQENPQHDNNIGVVPHSDSGCFTILWQDENGGLEVQNPQGDWVAAPPIANSFVVNIGNIMQYWSNGQFSSTPHRVINRNGADRYSIPYFVNPDHETIIKPLQPTQKAGFEPFEYGQYQIDLWRRTFPIANIP